MQYDFGTIDPLIVDGTELASMLNQWRDAIYNMQRGPTRPAFAVPGQSWVNDSGGPTLWLINLYISPVIGDVTLFRVNTITGAVVLNSTVGGFLPIGGGTLLGDLYAPNFYMGPNGPTASGLIGFPRNNNGPRVAVWGVGSAGVGVMDFEMPNATVAMRQSAAGWITAFFGLSTPQLNAEATAWPQIRMHGLGNPLDKKKWQWTVDDTNGHAYLSALSDNELVVPGRFTFQRDGQLIGTSYMRTPTAPPGTSSDVLATTAFVATLVGASGADKLASFVANRTVAATAFGSVGITVVFDSVTRGNVGGFYDAATGVYTPPAGRWLIGFNILSGSASGGTNETFELRKNGTPIAAAQQSNGGGSVSGRGTSLWVDANGTDQFSVYVISNPGTSNVLPDFVVGAPGTTFWAFQGDGLQGIAGPAGTPSGVTPRAYDEYNSAAGFAANIPQDDTIPQVGEGTQIFTRSYTASNAAHRVRFTAKGTAVATSAASICCAALFIDGAANAVRSNFQQPAGANWAVPMELEWEGILAAGAHTFAVRIGAGAGSIYTNTLAATRLGGGSQAWTFTIEELNAP